MEIRYSDGRTITVETEDEARAILDAEYPGAVYGDEWEPLDRSTCRRATDRLLVWATEEDAGQAGTGDGGQHAAASIVCEIE